ncbi:hypothetical protein E0L21_15705 [Kosakonia quasisacchari]|uniref:Uncharacterized protein n=1 Tax=Kosakonia quasisacchari TaxID=2529380 RepID=A0A4R0H708_9ENTR|nr:hypothetical protein [Kosakonia quasisacchari]TCC03439.1 hypothetical protein E0L21_15705 [Kosakonia quasisacchari]
MSALNKQELQVIQAFSSADLPERFFRDSNIKELISGMTEEQKSVQKSAKHVDHLRQEQKDGNFFTNWLNDRGDLLQDAQIDLNKSIGRLTQKSSQLLIVNTALSKLLNQQQQILLNQQNILEDQTRSLAEQNGQILKQQVLLEEQQKEINKANQGLMDAKGVTQDQAQQLVGCVIRVTEAENKIGEANATLLAELEQRVARSESDFAQQLQSSLAEQGRRHKILEQAMAENDAVQQQYVESIQQSLAQEQQLSHQQLLAELEQNRLALLDSVKTIANQCDTLQQELTQAVMQHVDRQTNTDNAVAALQTQFLQSRLRHRFALTAMACVVGLSVGWQIMQHFSLL